jgi:hypothetical protein
MNKLPDIYIFVLNSTFMIRGSSKEEENHCARELDDVLVVIHDNLMYCAIIRIVTCILIARQRLDEHVPAVSTPQQ